MDRATARRNLARAALTLLIILAAPISIPWALWLGARGVVSAVSHTLREIWAAPPPPNRRTSPAVSGLPSRRLRRGLQVVTFPPKARQH
jgi:hypothetical protein